MREYQAVETKHDDSPIGGDISIHPAFAQIVASRVSGDTYLYGSEFKHNHYVTISICKSQLRRDLSNDYHYGHDEMIEVALSEAQWATFVSSMNQGSGVCCTLQRKDNEMIPQLPETPNMKKQFKAEANETLASATKQLKRLSEQIKESGLSKKKQSALIMTLEHASRGFGSSMKFVVDQFGEHVENTLESAKIEVEAYLTSAINRAGVDALKGKTPIQIEGGASKRNQGEVEA